MKDSPRKPVNGRAETFSPGDIYEDCASHPCICVECNPEDDEIRGISLIDGSSPRNCSLIHCGVRKLTVREAWQIKQRFGRSG